MAHFVLVYDREHGKLIGQSRFGTAGEAMAARLTAERQHRGQDHVEIVALSAESEEALRETHARYFMSLDELAARMR